MYPLAVVFPNAAGTRRSILILTAALMMAQPAAAAVDSFARIASEIQSNADYARAFDRQTDGRFSMLVEKGDASLSLQHYADVVATFAAIEDALYDAHSPHANTLPEWYARRLTDLGLDALASNSLDFLLGELESGDFDRVVHAYYLASRSRLQLVTGERPTPLWTTMRNVAMTDPQDRYWISLALAEAKPLSSDVYDRLHTKMASRTESVRERIGKNADWLGARIPRVLGIDEADEKVAHLRIRYAKEAARKRVREHELVSMGGPAAYRVVREDLSEMETGEFESRRFLAAMRDDLPLLLERFGLPDDHDSLIETLRFLCRGRGANRLTLWDAAHDLARAYEKKIAAAPKAPPPPAPPDVREIVAMGDGAHAYLESTLRDDSDSEGARRLFEEDVISAVVAHRPPEDPTSLRRAIRDAYHTLGYAPELRRAYQRALDGLGLEESPHAATSRERLEALGGDFERARNSASFDRAFAAYRQASAEGQVPRRDVDPAFVQAFATAAVRLLGAEASRGAAAKRRIEDASRTRVQTGLEIEAAEAAIVDANRQIRSSNEALASSEERQQAAISARNEAVRQLNEAVERAEATRRRAGADFEAARAAARKLETELNSLIRTKEAEAREAGRAAEVAEQRAVDQLNRARREEARAKSAAIRENEATETEREADTALHRSEEKFAEVLGRLIAGLDFVGIAGDPTSVGDPARDEATRLAGVALLLEAERALDASTAEALSKERDGSPPPLRTLAELTLARRGSP